MSMHMIPTRSSVHISLCYCKLFDSQPQYLYLIPSSMCFKSHWCCTLCIWCYYILFSHMFFFIGRSRRSGTSGMWIVFLHVLFGWMCVMSPTWTCGQHVWDAWGFADSADWGLPSTTECVKKSWKGQTINTLKEPFQEFSSRNLPAICQGLSGFNYTGSYQLWRKAKRT